MAEKWQSENELGVSARGAQAGNVERDAQARSAGEQPSSGAEVDHTANIEQRIRGSQVKIGEEQSSGNDADMGGAKSSSEREKNPDMDLEELSPSELEKEGYPEQKHAGKIGIGPQYHQGGGFHDKLEGMKGIVKGKLTRNPDAVHKGYERMEGHGDGQQSDEDNPFASPEENKDDALTKPTDAIRVSEDRGNKERAATIAPEGSEKAEVERGGGNTDKYKYM